MTENNKITYIATSGKDLPIYKLIRDNEELDVSEFNIKSSSPNFDVTGDLLFYAFKEIKKLRQELNKLRGI